jgi:glucose dehydrogenase
MINDTLHLRTPVRTPCGRVVALDAGSGRELWSYDPGAYVAGQPSDGIDKSSGRTRWSAELGARGYANPMTYRTRAGRQFVLIATGAGAGAKRVAFALPAGRPAAGPPVRTRPSASP